MKKKVFLVWILTLWAMIPGLWDRIFNPAAPLPISCSEASSHFICFASSSVSSCLLSTHRAIGQGEKRINGVFWMRPVEAQVSEAQSEEEGWWRDKTMRELPHLVKWKFSSYRIQHMNLRWHVLWVCAGHSRKQTIHTFCFKNLGDINPISTGIWLWLHVNVWISKLLLGQWLIKVYSGCKNLPGNVLPEHEH